MGEKKKYCASCAAEFWDRTGYDKPEKYECPTCERLTMISRQIEELASVVKTLIHTEKKR